MLHSNCKCLHIFVCRIGGRVKDVKFGDIHVELGANWVQNAGMEKNSKISLFNMVEDAGLNFISDNFEDYIYRYEGGNVTEDADKIYETLKPAIEKTVKLANRKLAKQEPDINYRAALSMHDWRPKLPLEKAVEIFDFDFEFADEPEDTGLKSNAKHLHPHEQDDIFIADSRGFSQIIRNMADTIPLVEGKNIFFNKYVTKIKYNEPGDYPIKVIAKDSKTGKRKVYKAKWVIITFSIGVLESDLVRFVPKLPAWKMEVIYMFKMTRYIKIAVKFPSNIEAFWDDNQYISYVDLHVRGKYQIWQNLEARGKYYPKGETALGMLPISQLWMLLYK